MNPLPPQICTDGAGQSVLANAGADSRPPSSIPFSFYSPNMPEQITAWAAWPVEIPSGASAMNAKRHEVIEALQVLSNCSDEEFGTGYRALVGKLECVFYEEEEWMEEVAFPESKALRELHARLLGVLHNVHCAVMAGKVGSGREVVRHLLPQVLAFPVSIMDTASAMQNAQQEAATPV